MTKEELGLKAFLTAATSVIAVKSGIAGALMMILVCIMTLDFGTGMLRGLLTATANSTTGLRGAIKKLGIIILIGVGAFLEIGIQVVGIDTHNLMLVPIICFFIVIECLSVIENVGQLGVPIPSVLYNALSKLQEIGGKEQKVDWKKQQEAEKNESDKNSEI